MARTAARWTYDENGAVEVGSAVGEGVLGEEREMLAVMWIYELVAGPRRAALLRLEATSEFEMHHTEGNGYRISVRRQVLQPLSLAQ